MGWVGVGVGAGGFKVDFTADESSKHHIETLKSRSSYIFFCILQPVMTESASNLHSKLLVNSMFV